MKRYLPFIIGTLQAIQQPDTADDFRKALSKMEQNGLTKLVAAINLKINGERNAKTLCEPLDYQDSMIIEAILAAIDAGVQALADLSAQHRSG